MSSLSDIKTFSIRNFTADFPRMINESFNAVKSVIQKFYNEDSKSIEVSGAKVSGTLDVNTLQADNLIIRDGTNIYSLKDVLEKIDDLTAFEKRLDYMDTRLDSFGSAITRLNDVVTELQEKVGLNTEFRTHPLSKEEIEDLFKNGN